MLRLFQRGDVVPAQTTPENRSQALESARERLEHLRQVRDAAAQALPNAEAEISAADARLQALREAYEAKLSGVRGAGAGADPNLKGELADALLAVDAAETEVRDLRARLERQKPGLEAAREKAAADYQKQHMYVTETAFLLKKDEYVRAILPAVYLAMELRKLYTALGNGLPQNYGVTDLLLCPEGPWGMQIFGEEVDPAEYGFRRFKPVGGK